MPPAATGGANPGGTDRLLVVNEAGTAREVHLRTDRDGTVHSDRVVVETGQLASVRLPGGGGTLAVEIDTDRGEHASLTVEGSPLVVVRDGSVLVTD